MDVIRQMFQKDAVWRKKQTSILNGHKSGLDGFSFFPLLVLAYHDHIL